MKSVRKLKWKIAPIKIGIPFFYFSFLLFAGLANAAPIASFTSNVTTGCSPLSVQFSNTSIGAVSYYWDLGNGNTSTLPNPSNLYIATGSYTIILIATDGGGLKDTAKYINYITVVPVPTAGFHVAGATSSCLDNNSFSFISTSIGGSTYLWDFGDGSTSTQQNPVHSYGLSGAFTVTLIVTNAFGCSDQKILNQYITIYPKPKAIISSNATSSCNTSTVFNFTSSSTGAVSYDWDFGDGSSSTATNPSHTYSSSGSYAVTLIVKNSFGCADTSDSPIAMSVGGTNWASFTSTNDTGCAPLVVKFQNTTNDLQSCTWLFGDGKTSTLPDPKHTYLLSGSYTVTFIVTTNQGCIDTVVATNIISVGSVPTVDFSLTGGTGCSPIKVQFTNLSSGYDSCLWTFGDGSTSSVINPSHNYSGDGTFTVSLQCWKTGGCSDTKTLKNIISVSDPKAMFAGLPHIGCPPLLTTFTNFSSGNGISYFWDFGDGTTSTDTASAHTYTASGTFDVTLIISDTLGCADTLIRKAYIQTVNPAANYTPPPTSTGCAPFTTQFTDATIGSVAWLWNFGDGTTSTQQNPVHTYTTPGTYTVSLTTTTTGGGCQQTISNFSTFIVCGGDVGFTHTESTCPPYQSIFKDTSSNAISWFWDFGDGTTSTQQNPSHTFAVPGYHSVSLTITTSCGCTYRTMQSNGIYFEPFGANFYSIAHDTVMPTTVDFFANSTGATGWSWDFGDSATSTLQNPSHYYGVPGSYIVSLTITNGTCTMTYTGLPISPNTPDTSKVPTGVSIAIMLQQGCVPLTVSFSETVKGSASWHWDFGDGDTSSMQFPFHTYKQTGIYNVTLTTYDTLGLPTVLKMDSIVRVSGPTADFSFLQISNCTNTQIQFQDSSKNAWYWLWDFGDGTTDSTQNPMHSYLTNLPNNIVSLTVTDTMGCTSSISTSIFANFVSPMVASDNDVCGPDTLRFYTSIQNYPSYKWDFGDGGTSTLPNPTHLYTVEGTFSATLTIKDNNGCVKTFTIPSITVSLPHADFKVAGADHGCDKLNTKFTDLSINADAYFWEFGDGGTSTLKNPTHSFTSAGFYDVSLTVIRGMCIDKFTLPKAVSVDTAHADFSVTINGICRPVTATFTDMSVSPVTWKWWFGDGDSAMIQNPIHTYDSIPSMGSWLAIVDVNGCKDTAFKNSVTPLQANFAEDADSGCAPFVVHFTNTSIMGVNFYWDFGDGTTSTDTSPSHTYLAQGNYTVTLVAEASAFYNFCKDTLVKVAQIVVTKPVANFAANNLNACAPLLTDFADSSLDAVSWLWDFGDGSTSTNQNPSHVYVTPGTYSVSLTITNKMGCPNTLIRPDYILVRGPITKFNVSATEGCQPFTVVFTDQSINAIDWSWNFGDGYNSTLRNLSHTYLDSGIFTATLVTHDTAGCASFYQFPQNIIVHPKVTASFNTPDTVGCMPVTSNFMNTSTGMDSAFWDFGDGTTSTDINPSHTYTLPGSYTVKLIATSQYGCTDTFLLSTAINVLATPQPDFGASITKGCAPLYVTFNSTTTWTVGATYLWDFGNGDTSTLQNPTYTFMNPGFYSVSLTVLNNNGCGKNLTIPAYIHVLDTLPPPASNILSVSVLSNTSVEIQWENNAAVDLGGYILYRLNNSSGLYESIYTDTNISNTNFSLNPKYTDTGLNTLPNVYTYKVETFDICGYAIPLDSLKPHSTINVASKPLGTNIFVKWNAYGGCPVNSYEIYRCKPNKTSWALIASVSSSTLNYIDSTFGCPGDYSYRITGTDLCGNPYISNSDTSITTPINPLDSQVVDVVRSTVENNQFVLTEWKQPVVHPDQVVQFDVYRSTNNINYSYLTSVSPFQTDYMDYNTDVQKEHYYYKILVINTCAISEDLSGVSSSILLKGDMNEFHEVHLNWTPYNDWAKGVDYYIIEQKDANGNWNMLKKVDGKTLEYDFHE